MSTVFGTLHSYSNPQFSGLAEIRVRDNDGMLHTALLESGFGTRQLIEALGGSLNGEVAATYEIDDHALVVSVTPEER